ncbi:hypothetical protein BJ165DRAFT_1427279 [Panaeolus papilionaceus]|nr:hypothetical protein BJ165DRAFT_1427279 [Panaeolus papilionaceus]
MFADISDELSNRLQIRPPVPPVKTLKTKLKGKGEEIFNAAGPILNCLREVASLTPVPYLKQAAGLSMSLWTTIDAIRDNQANFERLRNTAVRLVIGLDASFNQSENANQWMDEHVTKIFRAIISDLQSVTAFCEGVTQRPLYKRAMFSMTDKGKIKEFDDRFRNAVLEFQTLSHVKLHESLSKLNDRSSEIMTENRKGVKTIIENENSNMNTLMSEIKITQAMMRSLGARNPNGGGGGGAVVTTTTVVDIQSRESRTSNQHLRPPSVQSTGRISTPSDLRRGSPTPSTGSGRSQTSTSRPSKSSKSTFKRTSYSSKRRSRNYESESEEGQSDQLSSEQEESEASGTEEEESEYEREKGNRSHCRKGSSSRRRHAPSPSPSPSPRRRRSPSPPRQPSPRPDHTPPLNTPPIFAHAPPSPGPHYPGPYPFPPSPSPSQSSYTPPPPSEFPGAYPSPPPSSYSHTSYGSYAHYMPPPVFQGTPPPGYGPAHLAPGAVMQVGSGTNINNVGNTYGGNKTVFETRIVAETPAPSEFIF